MSDIAVRADQQLDVPTGREPATAQLVQWAQAATAAYQFAEAVCSTQAVPAGYKGKPQEAAAAILAGSEVGLSPMASLRAFDNIQGTPAPKAITLRAIVQGRGHDLEVIEADAKHCIVEGRRKGSDRWQRLEWTIERAAQAGYVAKNPRWKADPTAQLVARATAEMSRWLDSAAIMGMPYAAEEVRDKGSALEGQAQPARLASAADFVDQPREVPLAIAATDDAIAAGASAPWGPGEREHLLAVSEALDEIKAAQTQIRLDEIKAACSAQRLTDQRVLDAWTARSAELADEG